MNAYTDALQAHADRIMNAARQTLAEANASPFESCSSDDKQYLRKVLYPAYQIKEIGRLRDDRLVCSTLLGDVDTPPRSREDVLLRDGTYIYGDSVLMTPGSHGAIIGHDRANVVLSPVAFDPLQSRQYSYAVSATDENGARHTTFYRYPADYDPGPFHYAPQRRFSAADGALKENGCNPQTGICVSVEAKLDRTSGSARFKALLATSFGMLAGGSIGLAWLYYRNRDRSLLSRLVKALAARELSLVYQPVVNVADGAVTGFEALARWEIRPGEFIPPDIFIARAEEAGIAGRITLYVLDRAIDEMGVLLRQRRGLRININMTASDLQDAAFMGAIEERLAAADIRPQQIGLELTERTAVDFAKATEGIATLRQRGHRVYIDDFGTGYSSLAYLGELHVDAIKIDKAFTRTVGKDCDTVSIVPQIVSMAREHGLDIVVEGIETEAQAAYFRKLDTPVSAQGWFYGKPMDAGAAWKLVAAPLPKKSKKSRNG